MRLAALAVACAVTAGCAEPATLGKSIAHQRAADTDTLPSRTVAITVRADGAVVVKRETIYDPEPDDFGPIERYLAQRTCCSWREYVEPGPPYVQVLVVRVHDDAPFRVVRRIVHISRKKGIRANATVLPVAGGEPLPTFLLREGRAPTFAPERFSPPLRLHMGSEGEDPVDGEGRSEREPTVWYEVDGRRAASAEQVTRELATRHRRDPSREVELTTAGGVRFRDVHALLDAMRCAGLPAPIHRLQFRSSSRPTRRRRRPRRGTKPTAPGGVAGRVA